MRVGFLLEQCLAPVPGGTGRYSRELAAALARTAPPGCSVDGWTAFHADLAPARVDAVGGPHRLPLARRPLIAAWERGVGPVPKADLVHAPTVLTPPRRGRPLVVTIHDAVPWTHPETLTPRGVRFHRAMGQRAAATADLVVVPTRAVAAELCEHLPLVPERLRVIGHGVADSLRVPPDAAARRAALGAEDGAYAVCLSTLEPRKGLDVVLDALTQPEAPGLALLVAGQPGWGGIDLAAETARRGLPPGRVRALGRLDDVDLAAVLDGALCLVAPSRAEGFGLPVLEAMSVGTPVVTSDAPALVEVGGEATVVTPVGDAAALAAALRDVASDPALRERLRAAGLLRAAEFSWTAAGEKTWAAYAEAAGAAP